MVPGFSPANRLFHLKASAISAPEIAPSRKIFHSSPCSSTMVEGVADFVSPPSRISPSRSPSCVITISALVHEGDPDKFALVPVSGLSHSSINRPTTSLRGQRSAIRPVFAVTFSGNRCDASTTSVNAPGQNSSASRKKLRGTSRASSIAWSSEFTRIGSARSSGRPFTRKISSTADKLNGSAASPYTVSVGIATTSPRCSRSAA